MMQAARAISSHTLCHWSLLRVAGGYSESLVFCMFSFPDLILSQAPDLDESTVKSSSGVVSSTTHNELSFARYYNTTTSQKRYGKRYEV